jgi:hypothetical protein
MGERVRRQQQWRPPEETHWERFAGEPTAADAAGPYSERELWRMNDAFSARLEKCFRDGSERRESARATYQVKTCAASSACAHKSPSHNRPALSAFGQTGH